MLGMRARLCSRVFSQRALLAPSLRPCARLVSSKPLCGHRSLLGPVATQLQCGGAALRRCSSGADDAAAEADAPEPELVYEGAKNKIVSTIKKVSIANLGFAIFSTPVLYVITNAAGMPGKGIVMSGLLLVFGGGTTGALTWCTSTYVLRMQRSGSDSLMITTPTFFGGELHTEVGLAEMCRPSGYHPFVTFSDASGRKYYLDELGEMHDESFPSKLEEALNAP